MRSKLRKIDPTSITNRPKIHQKSIGIDSGKRSVTEAQRGTTVKINIEAFWRHLADFGRHFGPRWISKGQSARCFSMYFAFAQNNKKTQVLIVSFAFALFDVYFPKPSKNAYANETVITDVSGVSRTPKSGGGLCFFLGFWRHLPDFGCHF